MPEVKIAFIVGHHSRKKGHWSTALKIYEYDFFYMVSSLLKDVDVLTYEGVTESGASVAGIRKVARDLNKRRYDLVIEGHFNKSSNSKANGCETLYYFDSKESKRYAELFSKIVCKKLGVKKRGANGVRALFNGEQKNYNRVHVYKVPMILIEPFFGSSSEDCKKIKSPEKVAEAIQEFINEVRKSKYRELSKM